MLCYDKVRNKPNVLLSFTSLTEPEFEKLLIAFQHAWKQYIEAEFIVDRERLRQYGGGRKPALKTAADRLLFILFYLKTYPLQEVLAFLFDMSQAQANEWIYRLTKVLKMALGDLACLPERETARLDEVLAQYHVLEFAQDGTERRCQRPKDNEKQREYYSGKKKTHTIKNNLVVHPESRKICYLSQTVPGKKHDKKLADESEMVFPTNCLLEQDTGYQGYAPERVVVLQPKKKPKGKELTFTEKFINRVIDTARIVAENVIAGVKRCRIVKDIFRNRKEGFADLVMDIACGLHNFRVDNRSPLQTIALVDFYFR
jgi:hypothetical protein